MTTYQPRDLSSSELAPDASLAEAVTWAVAYAVHAPSELNSQPWAFTSTLGPSDGSAVVGLLLDTSRLLPAVDPDAREAVLACGAALCNLLLVLHGAELATSVQLAPDPTRPDLLAEVTVRGRSAEPAADRGLRLAIPVRGSHRAPFDTGQVPDRLVDHLVAQAASRGAAVTVVDARGRALLTDLDAQAKVVLQSDPDYQREVAAWMRTNARRLDGVPGYAHGLTAWQSWREPTRDAFSATAVSEAPVLIVVGAPSDRRDALLRAGMAMQGLLLAAQAAGVSASFRNAAIQVPALRRAVGRAVGLDHPQVLLRLGYAAATDADRPVPRRPAQAVLTSHRPPAATEPAGAGRP